MTQQYIILAQSVTGAVVTIVALCLVAAVIGYLTTWYYAKSVYTPVIKKLEEEKADLQKQVAELKEEIRKQTIMIEDLNNQLKKSEETITLKDKEILTLKVKIKE